MLSLFLSHVAQEKWMIGVIDLARVITTMHCTLDEGRDSSEGRSNPIGGGSSWPSYKKREACL